MTRKSVGEKLWVGAVVMLGIAAVSAYSRARSARASAEPPPAPALAEPDAGGVLKNLEFRNIGPATMGGRIDDYAVVESNPDVIYVGTAAGGVFKTVNGGTTWTPIFDHETTGSIGAISVAPSDPSVLYVGTGEANNRQSASWGAGVYRSTDAGHSWQFLGLENTSSIGRVAIHPHDPNTAYVAALGNLWGPNKERGLYKTTDGGRTWTQSLFIDEDTGVTDVVIDPQSPNTVYAAAYKRRRTVFGFNGGGREGGIYKTTDGGATWRRLTEGLPYADRSEVGRIGLAVYRRNSNIVYARVQSLKGGIFRSEDKGETWTKMSDTDPRPSYFGLMVVDPNNDLRIWVPGAPLEFSEDGGKTFTTVRGQGVHSDYHGMWIDPRDSNHMIVGVDGGIYLTHDMGHTWDHDNIVAIGQFYEVTADNKDPYTVCGGLQDNGSWCGPSRSLKGNITNDQWYTVGGGDGFYNRLDAVDPNIDYAESQDGSLSRRNLETNESKSIRPREAEGEGPYRFQWNSPIEISPQDHKTIYYGGNFLFKSTDQGDHWVKLGPDLTTNANRREMKIFGQLPDKNELSREDGVEWWPCITVIGLSPLNPDVIYVGTDDGNLQVTRDGGKNWTNVASRVPGVPKGTYVNRVVPSKYAEGTAFAAFDGHRMGDFNIYIFMTTDYGQTWKAISSGILPKDGTVHVVREDPKMQNILYAGTERGLFISYDRGANWARLNMNLPTVPVDDILIHPKYDDMIVGTHGRSIWILDDITPLQGLNAQVLASNLTIFDIRPTTEFRVQGGGGGGGFGFGTHAFEGPNPPYGALIDFYLKSAPANDERVTIEVSDSAGKRVRQIVCQAPRPGGEESQIPPEAAAAGIPAAVINEFLGVISCVPKAGVNRVAWDLRYDSPVPPGGRGRGGGGGFFGGGGRGPLVDPGTYTVKVSLGSDSQTKTVQVSEDPHIQISDADRTKRHDAIMKGYELSRDANRAQREITELKTALDAAMASWKRPGESKIPENVQKAADEFSKNVNDVSGVFVIAPEVGGEQGGAGPALVYHPPTLTQRIGQVYGSLQGMTLAPTPDELAELDAVTKALADVQPKVQKLVTQDLPNFNKLMNDAGIPHIVPAPAGPGGGRRGRG